MECSIAQTIMFISLVLMAFCSGGAFATIACKKVFNDYVKAEDEAEEDDDDNMDKPFCKCETLHSDDGHVRTIATLREGKYDPEKGTVIKLIAEHGSYINRGEPIFIWDITDEITLGDALHEMGSLKITELAPASGWLNLKVTEGQIIHTNDVMYMIGDSPEVLNE